MTADHPANLRVLIVLMRAAHDARSRGDLRGAREFEQQVTAWFVAQQRRLDDRTERHEEPER